MSFYKVIDAIKTTLPVAETEENKVENKEEVAAQ